MKILHITASYKPAYIYGGPVMSVAKLCEEIQAESGRLKAESERLKAESEGLKAESRREDVGNQKTGDGRPRDNRGIDVNLITISPKTEDRSLTTHNSEHTTDNFQPTTISPKTADRGLGSDSETFLENEGFDSPQPDKMIVSIYTTLANGKEELPYQNGETKMVDGVEVTYFKRITKDHSHLSPALLWHLWKTVKQFDVVHIHAWWNLVSVLGAFICIIRGKKYILSPRGTLSYYSFGNRNSFVKQVFHNFLGKPLLKKATFQVSSEKEKCDILNLLGSKPSIKIIPNFVELRNAWNLDLPIKEIEQAKLLFFSRIEEKKGLEFLLEACSLLKIPFTLTIAGHGQEEYVLKLKNLAEQLGVTYYINWLGQINPHQKFQTLASYDLLVLPSYDENFANVVIESLACGTAVLLSPQVGLADYVQEHKLGWVCSQKPEELADTIASIFKNKLEHLARIREYAPTLIKEDYDETNLRNIYVSYYQSFI